MSGFRRAWTSSPTMLRDWLASSISRAGIVDSTYPLDISPVQCCFIPRCNDSSNNGTSCFSAAGRATRTGTTVESGFIVVQEGQDHRNSTVYTLCTIAHTTLALDRCTRKSSPNEALRSSPSSHSAQATGSRVADNHASIAGCFSRLARFSRSIAPALDARWHFRTILDEARKWQERETTATQQPGVEVDEASWTMQD